MTPLQWKVLDGVLAVVLMACVVQVAGLFGSGSRHASDLEIGLALVACAAVAVRRRWPIPVLVLVAVLVAVSTGLGQSFNLVPIVALPMATVAMGYRRKV